MPYIPHTEADRQAMLAAIDMTDMGQLFSEIPLELQCDGLSNIPDGISEMVLQQEAKKLSDNCQNGTCFIGAGSYDHYIPAAVWDIATRGEYMTAYTPYQAEASQGTLQLLYEYQTMMAELTAMDIANASMYDGASALAEAVLMACRINPACTSKRILVVGTLHPLYRATLATFASTQHLQLIVLPFDMQQGITQLATLAEYQAGDVTALVIAQPNFFGCLEAVDDLTNWAKQHQAVSIAVVNPMTLALLKPPGEWGEHGVDIACGEGQPLGVPMASGGPYFGFFTSRLRYARQMPGRIVGRTVDKQGNPGFTLTLQAREQHIRRGKATSNICTNQGLLVTAATIYMSLMGAQGLANVAQACHDNTHAFVQSLREINGITTLFKSPFFHEALLQFDRPIKPVLSQLSARGILGGLAVEDFYPELHNCLLVCVTEMRSQQELTTYKQALLDILKN